MKVMNEYRKIPSLRSRRVFSLFRPFIPSACYAGYKIPKISPGAYISQRPFLKDLFLEGLIYGGKFAFQNRLG